MREPHSRPAPVELDELRRIEPSQATSDFPYARLFRERDPRAILARITDGDPLELERRCAERLRARAYLVDNSRLCQRAQVRVALHGSHYSGEPPIERWLLERVDESIDALLAEDEHEESQGNPYETWDARFQFLSYMAGVLPEYCRTASVRFNGQHFSRRISFFKLCIECISVEEALEQGFGPPDVLRERTLRALICFWDGVAYEDFSFVGNAVTGSDAELEHEEER